jgi:hypothetical protein
VQDLGLALQGQNHRPALGHHAQRLIGDIKNERSSQGEPSI